MGRLVDLRDGHAGPARIPQDVTAELASCLERFLDATADDGVLVRARQAVDAYRAGRADEDHHESTRDAPLGPAEAPVVRHVAQAS